MAYLTRVNDKTLASRIVLSSTAYEGYVFPDLIKIQRDSYNLFMYGDAQKGGKGRLHDTFKAIFPIEDSSARATLEFIDCTLSGAKYDEHECVRRGLTYSSPLRALLRLVVWGVDPVTHERSIKNIKEQEVYAGDIPMMTAKGTFIINGVERVVVSQLHRSPGVFFDCDKKNKKSYVAKLYVAKIIPYRGSWLDFEFDSKDLLFFRVDKKKKLPIVILLRALKLSNADILNIFYGKFLYSKHKNGWQCEFSFDVYNNSSIKLTFDLIDADSEKVVLKAGSLIDKNIARKLYDEGLRNHLVLEDNIHNLCFSEDIINQSTGNKLASAGDSISSELLNQIELYKINSFYAFSAEDSTGGLYMLNSLLSCRDISYENALFEIYSITRPGETPSLEAAELLFHEMFFDHARYDLSSVGRMKIGVRLGIDWDENDTILNQQDMLLILKELISIRNGYGVIDDIDDLGNRRVRSVGEFIENQLRIGSMRMKKAAVEYMATVNVDVVMPFDLVNPKILMAVIKEFFTSSSLSQFMDQNNPLSEITHKRRLSALGPGGLTRDRAGFEVRDVHTSHYGRICPIETPEGQNIGLINSLATCARINKYGFIESPYRRVEGGVVSDGVEYLSAVEERDCNIAQANVLLNEDKRFVDNMICCRNAGEVIMVDNLEVDYLDLTPKQVVSVAASLIPFLENNDANRALMGSNMQRQAVPLLRVKPALVGTGMESLIARGSGALLLAEFDGKVSYIDSVSIVITSVLEDFKIKTYDLCKFHKSNDNTCINQVPIVAIGDYVKQGDVIADGPAISNGELALGNNLVVAFMSWKGYNFEDSIVISHKVVEEEKFTSIHIEEFECVVRDTRLGPEEITRDVPNIGEEFLCHLDEYGIVHIGAEVSGGDILVGKVTPRSEAPVTPEEKLLRSIFGEKAIDVRDTSLYLLPGMSGKVIDVRFFFRRGVEKDGRVKLFEKQQITLMNNQWKSRLDVVNNYVYSYLKELLCGKVLVEDFGDVKCGEVISEALLDNISQFDWWDLVTEDIAKIKDIRKVIDDQISCINKEFESKIDKLQSDDDNLGQGVLRVVKVLIAAKYGLQVGDKMSGRHGNKGVVSKVVAKEDMPYLEDGTPVDVVLNSLGIPSRMNIGQILESHLSWACLKLRKKIKAMIEDGNTVSSDLRQFLCKISYKDAKACELIGEMDEQDLLRYAKVLSQELSFAVPVFESPKDKELSYFFNLADLDSNAQEVLYDGATGEKFDRKVTVGSIYMLKLHHLAADKLHARSVGSYSLITQQPLGGKSYFGGQRFGEMECWALQAYGASYALQEMLTIKSDDVVGRIKLYDSIIRNDSNFTCGVPESFYVMVNELRALCLDVQLYQGDEEVVN